MRTVVIGLDGARLDVLEKWAREGRLPNIRRLMDGGVVGTLETVLPIHSFPAWTSLSTGTYPHKHGVHDVLVRDSARGSWTPPNSSMVRLPRYWEILDRLGYRTCIVNVPVTYPPKRLRRGVIVSSVLTPSTDHVFALPESVWDMMRRRGYKILPTSRPGSREYLEEVHEIAGMQFELVEWFMDTQEWDHVFWVVMSTEMLHHHYAPFIDVKHPLYSESYEGIVMDLYSRIDYFIGRIMRRLDSEDTIIVVSDHGFAPYHGVIYMNSLLRLRGLLAVRGPVSRLKMLLLEKAKTIGKRVYRLLPKGLKERALRVSGFGAHEFALTAIDWDRTLAFTPVLDGGVYVNLRGRDVGGVVEPEKYHEVVDRIASIIRRELEKLGISAIVKTWPEVYGDGPGPGPDIFILFGEANERPYKIKTSPFSSRLVDSRLSQFSENVGYHTLHGILLVHGGKVRGGQRIKARIVDVAPTILALHGIKPPAYMDGKALESALELPENMLDYHGLSKRIAWSLRARGARS